MLRRRTLMYAAVVGVLLALSCPTHAEGAAIGGGPRTAPLWNQDEQDLASLGSLDSLDSLLAYDDLQQGPDPWGSLQNRVKRNREPGSSSGSGSGGPIGSTKNGIRRSVRNSPGNSPQRLSIVNPLDVLRQRLLLEIARRRKASSSIPQSNRDLLAGIGKRSDDSLLSVERLLDSDVMGLQRASKQAEPQEVIPNHQRGRDVPDGVITLRDESSQYGARRQANGWSRNVGAATNTKITS